MVTHGFRGRGAQRGRRQSAPQAQVAQARSGPGRALPLRTPLDAALLHPPLHASPISFLLFIYFAALHLLPLLLNESSPQIFWCTPPRVMRCCSGTRSEELFGKRLITVDGPPSNSIDLIGVWCHDLRHCAVCSDEPFECIRTCRVMRFMHLSDRDLRTSQSIPDPKCEQTFDGEGVNVTSRCHYNYCWFSLFSIPIAVAGCRVINRCALYVEFNLLVVRACSGHP